MKSAALLSLLCCLIALPAAAGVMRPKIAILTFDSSLDKKFEPLAKGMPDVLTACFSSENIPADIVDRSAIPALMAEQTINMDASHVVKIEGATHLLRGTLAPQDSAVIVTLMLYDLASTKLVASATVTGGVGEIPETACAGVRQLGDKLPALKAETAPATGDDDAQAEKSRLMIEGLGAYYNGAFEKAFPPFMKLIHEDPANASAVYWLAKSYDGADMMEQARLEYSRFMKEFPKDPRAGEVALRLAPAKEDKK